MRRRERSWEVKKAREVLRLLWDIGVVGYGGELWLEEVVGGARGFCRW